MTINETLNEIKNSSAREVVEAAILRAKEDGKNAVLQIIETRALERADLVDKGKVSGKLAGVPFLAKDNFLTFDSNTTASSKILKDFKAPIQATAIEKLEAEGAICIGKVNLDAFAHGGSTENSAFGVTKNAVDDERVAGGSSGGSAVAVATGIVPFTLGSDTGGSIRQPASFNGVVGYKPSYGLISRFGVVAMASSTDVVGPIANSVEDIELLTDILSGQDNKDMTVVNFTTPVTEKPRIAVIEEFMSDGLDNVVKNTTQKQIEKLEEMGYKVDKVSLKMAKYALPIYYIVVPAELSSNLGRYDGIRYGLRSKNAKTLGEVYGMSRDEGFETENKRRILIGSYVLSSGFFDAYYLQAQKARTLLINEFNEIFKKYDLLLGPVAPTPAFKIGENVADPLKMYLTDVMSVPASLAGLPAISMPMKSETLPIGLQIIGKYGDDKTVLNFAKIINREVENE